MAGGGLGVWIGWVVCALCRHVSPGQVHAQSCFEDKAAVRVFCSGLHNCSVVYVVRP